MYVKTEIITPAGKAVIIFLADKEMHGKGLCGQKKHTQFVHASYLLWLAHLNPCHAE